MRWRARRGFEAHDFSALPFQTQLGPGNEQSRGLSMALSFPCYTEEPRPSKARADLLH
ncbi:MAG: hypothetical protein JWP08_3885 [Bryobacterales bacterium]|nr:hypothetical protein [Bryobacterales bacterium]